MTARSTSARSGSLYAFGCTVLFATRDNVVRHIADDSTVAPQLAASVTILSGTVLIFVVLVAPAARRVFADIRRDGLHFVLPGVLWGASYAFLFEAFYRSRVVDRQPAGRDRVTLRRPARGAAPAPDRARRPPPAHSAPRSSSPAAR